MRLNDVKLLYPAVYESRQFDKATPNYSVAFINNGDAADMLRDCGIEPKERKGGALFNAKSKHRPLITEKGRAYKGDMLKAFAIAEARNMPLNRLLINVQADIIIRVIEYNNLIAGRRYKGKMTALEEIIVSGRDLYNNAIA